MILGKEPPSLTHTDSPLLIRQTVGRKEGKGDAFITLSSRFSLITYWQLLIWYCTCLSIERWPFYCKKKNQAKLYYHDKKKDDIGCCWVSLSYRCQLVPFLPNTVSSMIHLGISMSLYCFLCVLGKVELIMKFTVSRKQCLFVFSIVKLCCIFPSELM